MAIDVVSPDGRDAELYSNSSGERVLNEDQIPQPFEWDNTTDEAETVITVKDGYRLDISGSAVVVPPTGGGTDAVFWENDKNVTTDYTITTDKNAMSAGPIEIDAGVTVTVPVGSVWTIV